LTHLENLAYENVDLNPDKNIRNHAKLV